MTFQDKSIEEWMDRDIVEVRRCKPSTATPLQSPIYSRNSIEMLTFEKTISKQVLPQAPVFIDQKERQHLVRKQIRLGESKVFLGPLVFFAISKKKQLERLA